MKNKFLSIALSCVMAASVFVAGTGIVYAADESKTFTAGGNIVSPGGTANVSGNAEGIIGTQDIDVTVKTVGGDSIRYSVKVTWGDMDFTYDYGSVWNPETHTYSSGLVGGQNGGWLATELDGNNNKITVENNSNYPVQVDLSFTLSDPTIFNAVPADPGSVQGVFTTSGSAIDLATDINTLTGVGDPNIYGLDTFRTTLEMVTDSLTAGQTYYDAGTSHGSTVDVFFGLCGTPDPGLTTLTSATSVGTITVQVKPVTTATLKTK